MRTFHPTVLVLMTLTTASQVLAERPLRQARSDNGRFVLRIEPGRAGRGESPSARGTLLDRSRGGQPTKVWAAPLVNTVAPARAFVRDDGRFVITLDEYRRGGARHALVVYGEQGAVLREFELRELLSGGDWKRVRVRGDAVQWLPGARFEFVESPEQFRIRLKWGREIRVDLAALQIVSEPGESPDEGAEIPPEVLEAINRESAATSDDGTRLVDEEEARRLHGLREAVLQRLEALRQSGNPVPHIERLLLDALARVDEELELLEPTEDSPDGPADALAPGEEHPLAADAPDATGGGAAPPNGDTLDAAEDDSGEDFVAAYPGLRAPAPDPAAPVDYLAWANEQTRTAGPSAAPLIQLAAALHVDYGGPDELFAAALAGDPEALHAPEITEWLESNRNAIETLRQARDLEYHGLPMHSESGLLLDVWLPPLSMIRQLSRGILLEGKRFESEGQLERAAAAYADALAVGTQAGQGPTLIENLVGMDIQSQARESLLDLFAAAGDQAIDYAAVQELLGGSNRSVRPMSETIEFERACLLDLVQRGYEVNPETGHYRVSESGVAEIAGAMDMGKEDPVSQTAMAFFLGSIGFERMVAVVNRHFDSIAEAMALPYAEGRQEMDAIERENTNPIRRLTYSVISGMLPALSRANFRATRSEAGRRATLLVAELRAYQQQHGQLPETLEALGGIDAQIDPFTGQSFHYRRQGGDFVLYSAAGNGADDGGTHDPRGENGDLLYWPRPPKQQPTK
jgi:hypothetical protein